MEIPLTSEELKKLNLLKRIENIKQDQTKGVLKYMQRKKSLTDLQQPLHNYNYYNHTNKQREIIPTQLQTVQIDPLIYLDESKEEKWTIISSDYKELIDKSKSQTNIQIEHNPIQESPPKIQFTSKHQSIQYRLKEITNSMNRNQQNVTQNTQVHEQSPHRQSNHLLQDPYYDKFKKYYQKIGIQCNQEQPQPPQSLPSLKKRNQSIMSQTSMIIFTPVPKVERRSMPQVRKKRLSIYQEKITSLQNRATKFQQQIKQQNQVQLMATNHQLSSIQIQFNKYHEMLTTELEKLDYLEDPSEKK